MKTIPNGGGGVRGGDSIIELSRFWGANLRCFTGGFLTGIYVTTHPFVKFIGLTPENLTNKCPSELASQNKIVP